MPALFFHIIRDMEQNIVVVMIDEEIERLTQVRDILESLLPTSNALDPLLETAVAEEPADMAEPLVTDTGEPTETQAVPAVKLRNSRRGMRTGPRGPRLRKLTAAPTRALDSAVPSAPVVVRPGSLHLVSAPPPPPRPVKVAPVHKLDSLLAAAFANMQ